MIPSNPPPAADAAPDAPPDAVHDVIIVGGSYAGLSAAIQLGRARRSVLIIDAGQRRNRFAHSAHGFLGQDGQSPAVIAARGKAEALAYPTVRWLEASVSAARNVAEDGGAGFAVRAGDHEYRGRRLILATGVKDELPAVPGLAERWGATVFHCPYCHGYELDRGRLGALATSPLSLHHAALVAEWAGPGQMTLFLDGAFEPDADQEAGLVARGVALERQRVVRVDGAAPLIEVHLADGRSQRLDGLFVLPRLVVGGIGRELGCALDEGPLGAFYRTDFTKETSVPGVFACGDTATAMGSLAVAVADGVMAGVAAHRSLVFPGPLPGARPASVPAPAHAAGAR